MTLQNTEGLNIEIKKVGCLFLSLMRIVELEAGIELTPYQINFIWNLSKKKSYLNTRLECRNPDGIIKEFFYLTTMPRRSFAQVGMEKQGKIIFWEWAKKVYTNYKYKIEKVKTYGDVGTHFRLCNKDSELIYDSYSFKNYQHEKIEEYTLFAEIK